ncbi:MAG: antitoxin VapB family protein [Thermoprotei archaeon]|nr:antitoxin VapB family protein [Thermoprotei archaeon]
MGVKTITISIEAYNALVREKRPGESFSDVILRLIRSRGDLMELAGSWSDLDDEEVGESFASSSGCQRSLFLPS